MTIRSIFASPLPALAALLALAACGPDGPDAGSAANDGPSAGITMISNARIHTFDAGNTVIEDGAMAISASGEILAVGDGEAMERRFEQAERVDLAGKTVLPGLIDAHGHLYGLAISYTRANLVGARSKSEVIGRLKEFEGKLSEGEWLLGHGWDQNDWPEQNFPTRQDLDAEFPGRPVWLRRIDGHAGWGNSRALAQADKDLSGDWQPDGGHIHRDESGNATGIFVDKAMAIVDRQIPEPSTGLVESALHIAVRNLLSLGLTGVHDPGVDRKVVDIYHRMIAQEAFPIRVYAMADGMGETLEWLCREGPLQDPSGHLMMRSVKLYADGALGSRGAALLEDYSDDAGNRGLQFYSQEQLESDLRRVLSCGLQAGVHAIGDAANRRVLDAYGKVLPGYPDNPGRHRIEHAQILHPADIPRFGQLGVIAAMQPIHATSDMYWAEDRLGAERLAGSYAWQSLLETGARLSFGSDFPVEEVNPLLGIYAAVSRQDLQGWPEGGWLPEQRLGRTEAIRAFTLDAAWSGFMEHQVGSLEAGKRADFIVLNRDIMQVPTDEIPDVRVDQTWVDGKRVFSR